MSVDPERRSIERSGFRSPRCVEQEVTNFKIPDYAFTSIFGVTYNEGGQISPEQRLFAEEAIASVDYDPRKFPPGGVILPSTLDAIEQASAELDDRHFYADGDFLATKLNSLKQRRKNIGTSILKRAEQEKFVLLVGVMPQESVIALSDNAGKTRANFGVPTSVYHDRGWDRVTSNSGRHYFVYPCHDEYLDESGKARTDMVKVVDIDELADRDPEFVKAQLRENQEVVALESFYNDLEFKRILHSIPTSEALPPILYELAQLEPLASAEQSRLLSDYIVWIQTTTTDFISGMSSRIYDFMGDLDFRWKPDGNQKVTSKWFIQHMLECDGLDDAESSLIRKARGARDTLVRVFDLSRETDRPDQVYGMEIFRYSKQLFTMPIESTNAWSNFLDNRDVAKESVLRQFSAYLATIRQGTDIDALKTLERDVPDLYRELVRFRDCVKPEAGDEAVALGIDPIIKNIPMTFGINIGSIRKEIVRNARTTLQKADRDTFIRNSSGMYYEDSGFENEQLEDLLIVLAVRERISNLTAESGGSSWVATDIQSLRSIEDEIALRYEDRIAVEDAKRARITRESQEMEQLLFEVGLPKSILEDLAEHTRVELDVGDDLNIPFDTTTHGIIFNTILFAMTRGLDVRSPHFRELARSLFPKIKDDSWEMVANIVEEFRGDGSATI